CREAISISDQARHEGREKRDAHVGPVNHRDDAAGEILRRRFHRRRNNHRTKRPEQRTESSERYRQDWASTQVRNRNDDDYARDRERSDKGFVAEAISNPADEGRPPAREKIQQENVRPGNAGGELY